uniref:Uncharacterized protein n=1 Tax=Neobodo designis TaxID=312471 RepID=A0A7S1M004_NEODS
MQPNSETSSLLWETLKALCRGTAEADFIRGEVGEDLFAQNERLFTERSLLLEIANELGETPDRPEGFRTAGAPLHQARQLAMQERMKLLLLAAGTGAPVLRTPREKMVAEYIANGRQRPSSASAPGVRPSSRGSYASAGSSRPSSRSTPGVVEEPVVKLAEAAATGRLQHTRVNEIREDLRELLREEERSLLDEIDGLRSMIDESLRWKNFAEPAPHELGALQQQADDLDEAREHASVVASLPMPCSRLQPLQPTPPRSRPSPGL